MGKLNKELKVASAGEESKAHLEELESMKKRLVALYQTRGFDKLTQNLKYLEALKPKDRRPDEFAVEDLNQIIKRLDSKEG